MGSKRVDTTERLSLFVLGQVCVCPGRTRGPWWGLLHISLLSETSDVHCLLFTSWPQLPQIFWPVLFLFSPHGGSDGKKSTFNARDQVPSLGREDPLEREWQPTPVFLPGESHGWRSLVDYSPRGCKESDMTERLHVTTSLHHSKYSKWRSFLFFFFLHFE